MNTPSTAAHIGPPRRSVPSMGTLLLALVGLAAVTALAIVSWTEMFGEDAALIISDLGNVAISAGAAAVIFVVARSFGGGQVSRPWTLLGVGVALYAMGDATWAYLELIAEVGPYPSAADLFYFAQYAFVIAAMLSAVWAYRQLIALKKPLVIAAAVSVVSAAIIYATLLAPYILPAGAEELGSMGLLVSVAYPLCDVFLMLGPAVFLIAAFSKLGGARLSWPWWLVAASSLLYAAADTWYSFADWAGTYDTYYAIIDSGWLIANVLFMVAVLIARDVFKS